ncbi:MAG: hypothetical protein ABH864_05195 [archaeon]
MRTQHQMVVNELLTGQKARSLLTLEALAIMQKGGYVKMKLKVHVPSTLNLLGYNYKIVWVKNKGYHGEIFHERKTIELDEALKNQDDNVLAFTVLHEAFHLLQDFFWGNYPLEEYPETEDLNEFFVGAVTNFTFTLLQQLKIESVRREAKKKKLKKIRGKKNESKKKA